MPQTIRYTVAKSTYVVLGVLSGVLAAIGVAASVSAGNWQPAVACPLPLLLVMVWLSRYRLEIGDGHVAYRSWLGSRRLDRTTIVAFEFAGMPLSDPEIPSSACVLRSADGTTISVNLKLFPREAALRLVHLAGARDGAAI